MISKNVFTHWLVRAAVVFAVSIFSAATVPAYAIETVTYYHLDALGSPVAATDEQGNLKWREDYKPYGEKIRNEAAASSNTRAYTGHPHDNDTGLTYAGARYYDPVVGRFMGVDSAPFSEANLQSFGRYTYANNSPYRYIDPDGRVSLSAEVGIELNFSFGGWGAVWGRQFGFAISMPTSLNDGSVFDAGFITTKTSAGEYDPNFDPRFKAAIGPTVEANASGGSVTDLEGKSTVIGGQIGVGAHVEIDDQTGQISGGGVHASPGIGVSITGEDTNVFSARRGVSRVVSGAVDAVDRAVDRLFTSPLPTME